MVAVAFHPSLSHAEKPCLVHSRGAKNYFWPDAPSASEDIVKSVKCNTYLTDGEGPRVPHTESLRSLATEEGLARGRPVQNNVAHNDVVLRLEVCRHVLGRIDDNLAPRQRLQDKQQHHT